MHKASIKSQVETEMVDATINIASLFDFFLNF